MLKGWYFQWLAKTAEFPSELVPNPPKILVLVPTLGGVPAPEDLWIRYSLS